MIDGLKLGFAAAIGALLCVSVSAPSQANAQLFDGQSQSDVKVTVHGTVEDSISHQPIARALVDGNEDAVLTDNEGHFSLNLHEGFVQVQVRRPGYKIQQAMPHMLQVGANMPEVTFYLTPSASIHGHVTVQGDDSAEGVQLMEYRKQVNQGHAHWITMGMAVIDSEGEFTVRDVDGPGAYIVCSMTSFGTLSALPKGQPAGYASTCFPGATEFASATPLNVAAGEQADMDITLTRQPFYQVTIAMPAGSRAQAMIFNRGGNLVNVGLRRNEQAGTMEVSLPNGSYYAEAHAMGKPQLYGRIDFTVANAPVVGLSMALHPLHPVPVTIHRDFTAQENNRTTMNMNGTNPADNPGLNLMLMRAGMNANGGMMGGGLRRAEGTSNLFEMDAVPGLYRVQTWANEGYVSSITSGGVDLARDPLTIGPGNSTQPIDVVLRNDGGQIDCTVNTGDTAQGNQPVLGELKTTMVYAIPLFPTTGTIPQQSPSPGRPMTFSNLPPGSYRVAAYDRMQEFDLDDAQSLARLTAKGKTVTVTAGATTSVELELTKGVEQEGAP